MSKVPTMQAWICCHRAHPGMMRPMDRIEIHFPTVERGFIIDTIGENFQAAVVPKGVILKHRVDINLRGLHNLGVRRVTARKDGTRTPDRLRFTLTGQQDANIKNSPAFGLSGVVAIVDLVNKTIFVPFVVEELRKRVKRQTYVDKTPLQAFLDDHPIGEARPVGPAMTTKPLVDPAQENVAVAVRALNDAIELAGHSGISIKIFQPEPGMAVGLSGTQQLTF